MKIIKHYTDITDVKLRYLLGRLFNKVAEGSFHVDAVVEKRNSDTEKLLERLKMAIDKNKEEQARTLSKSESTILHRIDSELCQP